jgi:predicted ATPase
VEKLAILRILSHLFSPTYIAAPALLPIVTCEQVNLSVKYGNASFSPYAYANYSAILNGVIQDVESAYQFGNLALNLLERLNPKEFKAKTINQVAVFTLHAKVHIRETFPLMQEAYKSGVENGDLEFAGYAATQRCQYLYWSGLELPQLETEISIYSNALAHLE